MPAPKDPEKRKKWIENISRNTKFAMSRPEVKKKMLENQSDRSGKNNPMYGKIAVNRIDTKIKTNKGYWLIWINGKRILQSRYVAEKCLKRKLKKEECVHHLNEDKSDDRPENLYVFSTKNKHVRQHALKMPPLLISNLKF